MSLANMTIRCVDRIPPQNLDMEQAVVGSMLIEPQAREKAMGLLDAEDFYRDAHGTIFAAISRLHSAGQPVDLLTVQEALKAEKKLGACGGTGYLCGCMDAVASAANVAYYAAEVLEQAGRRHFVKAMREIWQGAYDAEAATTLARVREQLEAPVLLRLARVAGSQSAVIRASEVPSGQAPDRIWFGLYEGAVVLLVGETGSGKSSLLYNIAIHAALGKPFCGVAVPTDEPARVLYVDPENAGNWKEGRGGVCGMRLDRLGLGRPDGLLFHSGDGLNLSQPGHMAAIEGLSKDEKIRLIILDPIANLFATEDENSNAEAARQMRALVRLSRVTGACIVACHHTGKDDTGNYGRGASARLAAADVGMVLRVRKRSAPADPDAPAGALTDRRDVCRLEIVKNRLEGRGALYLSMEGADRFAPATARDWQSDASAEVEPTRKGKALAAAMAVLQDGQWHPRAEVHEAMRRHVGEALCRSLLADMKRDEAVSTRSAHGGALSYRLARPDAAPGDGPDMELPGFYDSEDDPFAD